MTYHSITTLAEIRAERPCEPGWEKLLKHLGKTQADDEPLPLLTILDSNGFSDAVWCLRCPSLERLSRHFRANIAERVLHIFEAARPGDMRIRDQITMLRNDNATPEDRAAAVAAARAAAWHVAWAKERYVAWAKERYAAWAAVDTAWAAVDAARAAVWAAADDERTAQEQILRDMIGGAA